MSDEKVQQPPPTGAADTHSETETLAEQQRNSSAIEKKSSNSDEKKTEPIKAPGIWNNGSSSSGQLATASHNDDPTAASNLERRRSSTRPEFTEDGKRIITERECEHLLGFNWPTWKKWMLLCSIFTVQMSMNFNTSVYPSSIKLFAEHFGVSEQAARVGQCVHLIMYAFGCELWAPWSEVFGRWPILQSSLLLMNIWQLPCALAGDSFASLIAGRTLGGLSLAGGSVTLGMVADLYGPEEQQWAVAFIVLSSVGGTSIGPVIGGPIAAYLPWYWNFWVQLIFGGAVQCIHFFMPESRSTIIMDREARRKRKSGEDPNVWGPNEVKKPRISLAEFKTIWLRPFEMFLREPIVLCCSLLSGFSDALIFTFQEGFNPVYEQWGFTTISIAWAFIPINVGYLLAYASYLPWIYKDRKILKAKGPDGITPEHRLVWLLYLVPLLTIGLFGFAWTSLGPPLPWIAPMIFSCCIAIANYAIYMSTIDYMIAAYGEYSASATGGNGFARDFLAGVATMYSTPLYENLDPNGPYGLEYASTILACLAAAVTIPVYLIYIKGPVIRKRSKFAQSLDTDRHEKAAERRASQVGV